MFVALTIRRCILADRGALASTDLRQGFSPSVPFLMRDLSCNSCETEVPTLVGFRSTDGSSILLVEGFVPYLYIQLLDLLAKEGNAGRR